ncbi:MAG: glutamine amidotransferase family protein [Chloroflexota bacterium]
MKNIEQWNNPYNEDKVIAACGLFGIMDTSGRAFSGQDVVKGITNMHDRSNGLGGGFAAYGIYPDCSDHYAFHVMYLTPRAREETEAFFTTSFRLASSQELPTRKTKNIVDPPLMVRYFIPPDGARNMDFVDDDCVTRTVMHINYCIEGAFVFSSGKNMGVFKGVGYPEDIANFFRLDEYCGYMWVAHGRFPTNTPGWWGGAHPFNILDWTVVHNGEISSYGINRRFLEMYGYRCTMQTDTEVVAYAVDLLVRKHHLPIEVAARVMAPPFWEEMQRQSDKERALNMALRQTYGSLLMNGPFTVIVAHQGEMMGLGDRIRLRPLTAATKDDLVFLSSEESAIRLVCPELDRVWTPMGGEPVIARLKEKREQEAMAAVRSTA